EEVKTRKQLLVNCPAYYSVSVPKVELLTIKDTPEEVNKEEEQGDNRKKTTLMGSLTHNLETLQKEKECLLIAIKLNNALGEEVETLISELCKPSEFDKYKLFIGDLDKVVNLLLFWWRHLAHMQNFLIGLGEDASNEERSPLNKNKKVLARQHNDSQVLKDNLDQGNMWSIGILANYLSEEQLLKMKSTLLTEQVNCLLKSLPSDFIPKAGALALPPNFTSVMTPLRRCTFTGIFSTLTSPH
uniref:ASD2 domain-containing protein n=1 Tax=Myotis lucifugus TaxID=59463 RepID=G1Q1K9_MYOLU